MAERLHQRDPPSVSAAMLRLHADGLRIVEREQHLRDRFAVAHPQVATAVVPALASDVHDIAGLRQIGDLLAEQEPAST